MSAESMMPRRTFLKMSAWLGLSLASGCAAVATPVAGVGPAIARVLGQLVINVGGMLLADAARNWIAGLTPMQQGARKAVDDMRSGGGFTELEPTVYHLPDGVHVVLSLLPDLSDGCAACLSEGKTGAGGLTAGFLEGPCLVGLLGASQTLAGESFHLDPIEIAAALVPRTVVNTRRSLISLTHSGTSDYRTARGRVSMRYAYDHASDTGNVTTVLTGVTRKALKLSQPIRFTRSEGGSQH